MPMPQVEAKAKAAPRMCPSGHGFLQRFHTNGHRLGFVDKCVGICVDTCADMCVEMFVGMHVAMCVAMCAGIVQACM